jgi:hypothetical protein
MSGVQAQGGGEARGRVSAGQWPRVLRRDRGLTTAHCPAQTAQAGRAGQAATQPKRAAACRSGRPAHLHRSMYRGSASLYQVRKPTCNQAEGVQAEGQAATAPLSTSSQADGACCPLVSLTAAGDASRTMPSSA